MIENFAVKFVGIPEDSNGNPIHPDHCGQVIKEEDGYYHVRLRKSKRIQIERKENCLYWSKDIISVGELKNILEDMKDNDFIFIKNKNYNASVYDYEYYSKYLNNPYDDEKVGALFLIHTMSNASNS